MNETWWGCFPISKLNLTYPEILVKKYQSELELLFLYSNLTMGHFLAITWCIEEVVQDSLKHLQY